MLAFLELPGLDLGYVVFPHPPFSCISMGFFRCAPPCVCCLAMCLPDSYCDPSIVAFGVVLLCGLYVVFSAGFPAHLVDGVSFLRLQNSAI